MNKYLLLIISMVLFAVSMQAQSKKAYRSAAEKAVEKGDFLTAYVNYKTLIDYTSDSTDVDVLYNAAEAARKLLRYADADTLYAKVAMSENAASYPDAKFYQGLSKYNQMNYQESIMIFEEIQESSTAGEELRTKASQQAEYASWAEIQKGAEAKVTPTLYPQPINTPYVDAAPFWHDGGLFYTSVLNYDSTVNFENFKPIARVYKIEEGSTVGIPIAGNPTDKDLHAANFVVSPESGRKYINYCTEISKEKFHCKLYYSKTATDGSESYVQMPDHINNDSFTTTHPAVGINSSNQEVVYFVSDRLGGKGGLDIWSTTLLSAESYEWSQPENLSSLNTAGDDVTPFFHSSSKTIFYSTNGKETMGNFDIFKSTQSESGEWGSIENIGYPINEGLDDFHFTFNSEQGLATFTRTCINCANEENICVPCDDIYSYKITVDVNALVFAGYGEEETSLMGSTLKLIDIATGEVIDSIENYDGNNFHFPLELEKQYRLTASKPGWSTASVDLNTRGIFSPTTFNEKLVLTPIYKLEVYVFDADTKAPLTGTYLKFSEEDETLISNDFNEKGHDFFYNLTYGKGYLLEASKSGYTTAYETVSVINQSSPAITKVNLYLRTSACDYAFERLKLYFDNDHPNPRTTADNTNLYYGETYEIYSSASKLKEYIEGYAGKPKGYDDPKRIPAERAVISFFEDEVKYNGEKLKDYSDSIKLILDNCKDTNLEIILEGFASPRARTEYNFHLTNRRIDCVKNHFERCNGGALNKYFMNGRLKFGPPLPHGETKSRPGINSDIANRKESVYKPQAAQERRVEVSIRKVPRSLGSQNFLNNRIR